MYICICTELFFLSEGFLIMIKKYLLLTSFVFGVSAIFSQSCEALQTCCCSVTRQGKCLSSTTVLWGDCPAECNRKYTSMG